MLRDKNEQQLQACNAAKYLNFSLNKKINLLLEK